jgi:uncharacterized zinc-type alcohol dehydrogenase-like protein
MTITGYAAPKKSAPLESHSYEPAPLGPHDVDIDITHCGICHSDVHLIDDDWGLSKYPFIPGHEIIGNVTAKGDQVVKLEIGQRVGIGWQRSSCMHCESCHQGEENMCAKQEATCVGHNGGFANKIRADGRFAFPIPEKLSSENAAPLLCGGVTVFSPLHFYDVRPTDKVGVIGIGGLGHLALQFANAFGCEVTAFSHSPEKEAEAKKFGAHHFVSSSDLSASTGNFDFILCTISKPLDWDQYLALLKPKGKLCFVGAQEKPIDVSFFSLLTGRKTVCGSNIGSRPDICKMLEFAAHHGIEAQTEVFPLSNANEALDKLRAGKMRYRAVLKM